MEQIDNTAMNQAYFDDLFVGLENGALKEVNISGIDFNSFQLI